MISKPNIFRRFLRALLRFGSIVLSAYMLGISNVVLEEDRMINDTRAKIEQQEIQNEDDNL